MQPLKLRTLGQLVLAGASGNELLRRRMDLALLTVVADRTPDAVKREELQALFWGERTEEKARHSLRQAIRRLRQVCGDALEVMGDTLRVPGGAIGLDAHLFAEAAGGGRWHEAIALWTGQFLPDCEDVGVDDFRTWLEVERERLRRLLAHCYERAVEQGAASGEYRSTLELTSAWTKRFPFDELAQWRHIETLCRLGRVADASAARGAFLRRLREEAEEAPSAAWAKSIDRALEQASEAEASVLATRVQDVETPTLVESAADRVEIPRSVEAHPVPHTPHTPQTPRWRAQYLALAVTAAASVVAVAVSGTRSATARPNRNVALAVGDISSALPVDSVRGFATLLTINLARISELNVISERRLAEVATRRTPGDMEAIAQAAGARELLEGVLTRRDGPLLRADLRRIDLTTGKTRAAYTVEARDFPHLADLITEQVARELGVSARIARPEGATNSIIAYRLYEQGLRAASDADPAAQRFFKAALEEDSTFAMAALYVALTEVTNERAQHLMRAFRLAARASDRERLLISAIWGRNTADPRTLAWAETLLTRYPSEAEAHLIYAHVMHDHNNLPVALAHFRRVVEMDSGSRHSGPKCRACEAMDGMINVYGAWDSVATKERLARLWIRWESAPQAWWQLSTALGDQGRYAEAHAAIDSSEKYVGHHGHAQGHTIWWFRTSSFAEIDQLWREQLRSQNYAIRKDALWTGVISLRTQGRMREALELARQFRREGSRNPPGQPPSLHEALLEGVTLTEAGQPRRAAALFDSMAARQHEMASASFVARDRVFQWRQAATAYAIAGDTARLRAVEESIRVNAPFTSDRAKQNAPYVRGLRLAAEQRHQEAVDAFRQALFAPRGQFVRIYRELARALLATNRPAEAIEPLVTALKGPTGATGLYATRSDLQELLGLAYERSGKPDSAAVQYRLAAHAWRNADPQFAARRAHLDARIRALTRLETDRR